MIGQQELDETFRDLLDNTVKVIGLARESYDNDKFSDSYFQLVVVENVIHSLKRVAETRATADVGYSLLGEDVASKAEDFLGGENA